MVILYRSDNIIEEQTNNKYVITCSVRLLTNNQQTAQIRIPIFLNRFNSNSRNECSLLEYHSTGYETKNCHQVGFLSAETISEVRTPGTERVYDRFINNLVLANMSRGIPQNRDIIRNLLFYDTSIMESVMGPIGDINTDEAYKTRIPKDTNYFCSKLSYGINIETTTVTDRFGTDEISREVAVGGLIGEHILVANRVLPVYFVNIPYLSRPTLQEIILFLCGSPSTINIVPTSLKYVDASNNEHFYDIASIAQDVRITIRLLLNKLLSNQPLTEIPQVNGRVDLKQIDADIKMLTNTDNMSITEYSNINNLLNTLNFIVPLIFILNKFYTYIVTNYRIISGLPTPEELQQTMESLSTKIRSYGLPQGDIDNYMRNIKQHALEYIQENQPTKPQAKRQSINPSIIDLYNRLFQNIQPDPYLTFDTYLNNYGVSRLYELYRQYGRQIISNQDLKSIYRNRYDAPNLLIVDLQIILHEDLRLILIPNRTNFLNMIDQDIVNIVLDIINKPTAINLLEFIYKYCRYLTFTPSEQANMSVANKPDMQNPIYTTHPSIITAMQQLTPQKMYLLFMLLKIILFTQKTDNINDNSFLKKFNLLRPSVQILPPILTFLLPAPVPAQSGGTIGLDINDSYKQKYLKYKAKYLALKNQMGMGNGACKIRRCNCTKFNNGNKNDTNIFCQTIIDSETGKICGHKSISHN